MDPLFDQVRQRTDDLRRVADAARRERDLRAAAVAPAVARTPVAFPSPSSATSAGCDGEDGGTCTTAGVAA
ncbi:MAG TPA: hypothetical protein VF119_10130 [Candidatus Limnocylindrales bacterium]